jgi:Dolichyl-phosphate-mannose-protein mannosyltransferase
VTDLPLARGASPPKHTARPRPRPLPYPERAPMGWPRGLATGVLDSAELAPPELAPQGAARTAAAVSPTAAAARWVSRRSAGETVVLALAVVVGAVLRLVNLAGVGLNSDEAVYASQSASLAGNPHYTGLFPVVRAHPLLLQVLMSPLYRAGVPDAAGRYVTATFGLATVVLVYVAGRMFFDGIVGAVAALILAVMPYHVTVSRQILLDGPMTFFTTAALICFAVAGRTSHRRWLVAGGACLGLAALSKETAIIMVGSAFVFLALVSRLWRPLRFLLVGAFAAFAIAWTYPLLTAIAGGSRSGQSYLLWQLTRRPNHSFDFYLVEVGGAVGFLVVALAVAGLVREWWVGRRYTWREILLISWIAVPVLFFEVWPVKGFSYLMPIAPALALLAARALQVFAQGAGRRRWLLPVGVIACVATLAVPAVSGIADPTTSGLAGAGGTPGGRETGRWVDHNVAEGAQFLTIGPSMANLIQYYSGHRSDGLSVSPNPLHRNPTYHPILNADAALQAGVYQYVVWDAYSARRSPQFAQRVLSLAHKFGGSLVHVEYGRLGGRHRQALVKVYKVTP